MRLLLPLLVLLAPLAAAQQGPPMSEPGPGDRILVASPHPDDGVLCCSGYMQRALARGAQVAIVWITAGDGFTIDASLITLHLRVRGLGMVQLGRIRISEAQAAARSLGVRPENLHILGYPDQGLSALLSTHYAKPFRSPHTNWALVPYGEAPSFMKDITGLNLELDLAAIIEAFQPTLVLAPHAADMHEDHATTGLIVQRAMQARGELSRLHRYVIHAGSHWPKPRALQTDMALEPPPALAGLQWRYFALTAEEGEHKLRALRWHGTQWQVMAPYMGSFVRTNELFVPEQVP